MNSRWLVRRRAEGDGRTGRTVVEVAPITVWWGPGFKYTRSYVVRLCLLWLAYQGLVGSNLRAS